MSSEEEPNNSDVLILNVNLFKITTSLAIICVILSYFTDKYEYIRNVYNCLLTILIYNNLIFIYLVYKRIKELWKNY
jgi:hypothetical protein